MIELAVGKAQQTVNVNVNEEKLVKSLEYRIVDIQMHDLQDTDVSNRVKLIESFGYSAGIPALDKLPEKEESIEGIYTESEVPAEPVGT